ncbi:MAG: response regulator [Bacteroides sp.]|nr:response regulator [Bacteroides sp.]
MRKLVLLLLLIGSFYASAQTYTYIGVEEGLSNRQVHSIRKDRMGYMWFLTHEGIDRYDGKEFKYYKLTDGEEDIYSQLHLNWLQTDSSGNLWEMGKKGRIFRYDPLCDRFQPVYIIPEEQLEQEISYSFLDKKDVIWMCNRNRIFLYDTHTGKTSFLLPETTGEILCMAEAESGHFFIGTDKGIRYTVREGDSLRVLATKGPDGTDFQVNSLYYDEISGKLFIGTFQQGIYIYDTRLHKVSQPSTPLRDASVTCIYPLNRQEILIGTDGAGVYKMNTETFYTEVYMDTDHIPYHTLSGNSVSDMYVDNENRVWIANYPIGITVRNNRYPAYQWIGHSGNSPSYLPNNQINDILQDSEGDLWFATNNGIGLWMRQSGEWRSLLNRSGSSLYAYNHIFLSLAEPVPGSVWTGGYAPGIYQIDKKTLSTNYVPSFSQYGKQIQPDKYIRSIRKDNQGNVWVGGFSNLMCIGFSPKETRLYPGISSVTDVCERDTDQMWIGTSEGLFLLRKGSGEIERINLPVESTYICSLHQTASGLLYIGTNYSGLVVYNPENNSFINYHKDNSALISNNIYTIVANGEELFVLTTENGITLFRPREELFQNWTHEQGLLTTHFNETAGIRLHNGNFILGSSNGAVEFAGNIKLPDGYSSRMVFSDFKIFYETVYPGEQGSPLKTDINDTRELHLNYGQNIFSLRVSSINYDYPSDVLYSWKLEGFYDEWSRPERENTIRFTNLSPGSYVLHVRAVSNENPRTVLEERSLRIIISHPFWVSIWAWLLYLGIITLIGLTASTIYLLRRKRKESDEKIRFFINTAHDIRTPLSLIKAPLEELREQEKLSASGTGNINTALRNVNALLRLTTNLINFEKADTYGTELYISEYELNTYLQELLETFRSYADVKHIRFTYESNFHYLNVWFDKEKMDSILKNLISNAMKYTPENGSVAIIATEEQQTWSVEVRDTGIGIPSEEQKKLFKAHFRGSNAINSKVTGSGIGLFLVWKLVRLHKGKIHLSSREKQGSEVKVTFPKGKEIYRHAKLALSSAEQPNFAEAQVPEASFDAQRADSPAKRQRILIVEDNDELRHYLQQTLSEEYTTRTCTNGKEALDLVEEYKPDLILSDIMMPVMRGDELCAAIKNNIHTSHIPVILLTALTDEKEVMEGLKTGADEYILKPFHTGILKANIRNMLINRALLRNRYASLEPTEENEHLQATSDLDWKFMTEVKKGIEENLDKPTFNVDALCNLLHMSRTSFYTKIKALTGQAPADYIRLIRLKKAAQLLKERNHNITEIAEMTGFSDAKYFREVFKKHFQMSPSQYSKEQSKQKETTDTAAEDAAEKPNI